MHKNGHTPKNIASFEIPLKHKRQIAEDTFEFTFDKPKEFHYKAGQHVRLTVIDPAETDAEGNSRFFSLVSMPSEPDLVFAMRMRNTAFKRVLGSLQPGNKVLMQMRLSNHKASFALHNATDINRPAVFLIGGIGIVPAYSMIKDAIEKHLSYPIFLFYSNRRPEDAPYLAELTTLAKQNPSFKFIATMTEPEKSASSWRGETGRIDQTMLQKYVSDLQAPMYYIAGLPEMVGAMQSVLTTAGINQTSVRTEEFDGFAMNHPESTHKPYWKRHLPLVIGALAILAMVIVHTSAGISMSHANLSTFSLNNPISYLTIGLLLALIGFKVTVGVKIKRALTSEQGRLSFKAALKAHKPKKK